MMRKVSPSWILGLAMAFFGGIATQLLYQRWSLTTTRTDKNEVRELSPGSQDPEFEPQSHPVTFAPMRATPPVPSLPVQAREVDRIRNLTGSQARIRGRVFRVGHSAKSDTYFLNFGPSRGALTAVIFAPTVELFKMRNLSLKGYEGKEVEIEGIVKDHPQYGLEIIIENPAQIRMIN